MYNRYIPQSDGTYQRRRILDHPASPQTPPKEPPKPAPPVLPIVPCPQPEMPKNHRSGPRPAPRPCRDPVPSQGITEFLKQLLPKGLDTGDLLVIMLLLLMSGDCQEDPNSALLTLLLYLFL